MTIDVKTALSNVMASLRDPRAFARVLMANDLPRPERWQLLGLAVLIGVALTQLNVFLTSGREQLGPQDPIQVMIEALILERPLVHAMLQFTVLVITVFLIYWAGRMFRGIGAFAPGILMVAWVEFVLGVVRAAQAVIWLASPGLAALFGVASIGIFFYLLSNFVAELHGFASPLLVFVGILATMIVVLFAFSFLLVLVGVSSGVM